MISPVAIPVQTWTHLAVTLNGQNLRLYLNGKYVSDWTTNTVPDSVIRSACYFGKSDIPGVDDAYMKLDQIKFYNRGLSSSEVWSDSQSTDL